MDAAKWRDRLALYEVAEVMGIRKKLTAIKNKVDWAFDRVDELEQSVAWYREQQGKMFRKY